MVTKLATFTRLAVFPVRFGSPQANWPRSLTGEGPFGKNLSLDHVSQGGPPPMPSTRPSASSRVSSKATCGEDKSQRGSRSTSIHKERTKSPRLSASSVKKCTKESSRFGSEKHGQK